MDFQEYDSFHWRALKAAKEELIALDLPRIGDRVEIQKEPSEANLQMPCVILLPAGLWSLSPLDTCRFTGDYPVAFGVCDRDPPEEHRTLSWYLHVLERIAGHWMADRRGRRGTTPGLLPELDQWLYPQPQPVVDVLRQHYQFVKAAFVLTARAARNRS